MFLDTNLYSFREASGVWARVDYTGIPYSDGDVQENLLLNIVSNTKDRSVSSPELRARCSDWVTTYHFSSLRSNLLRPLNSLFTPGVKILEIGAGCGAITRFLGESGAEVLALEGSLRRAAIARARTLDLANVTVVSERFDDFECEEKFDVITLIGVLEYSNLFSQGSDSAISMLNNIKARLKPDGKLLIAIENQLGLKYFAGAREDHIGQVMYGIEGRYTKQQAETYGHHVLLEKLATVGLSSVQTLLPFPDYKLPVSVVTEVGANSDEFDASVFATQSVRADMQLPEKLHLIPELAWPVVFNNKLAVEMSNSFLLVASITAAEVFDKNLLAVHYGGERHRPFSKKTVFKYTAENQVVVKRELLSDVLAPDDKLIGFRLDGYETYIKGPSLSTEFIKIVTTPGWSMEYVAGYFRYYIECLEIALRGEGVSYDEFTQSTMLPPTYLDAIPSNFVIDAEGQPRYFEREWLAKEGLTVGHLVFRAALSLLGKISCFAIPDSGSSLTRGEFIQQLFEALSFSADKSLLDDYLQLESALHAFSTGEQESSLITWYPEHVLPGLYEVNDAECVSMSFAQIKESLHQAKEVIASQQQSKDIAEKLAHDRLAEMAALHSAKDIAERFAYDRLDKIHKLEAELQMYQSGILGKLSRLIKGNRN
ncbi:methyltransferase [Serratia fonticola]|uniref:class I SAM-dependent methyltransferase n=1 Tax=Serratia fonticola TaxID=47917 RepID=UPI001377B04E|nr:class I SAM-dependent methyltransferase [Serratia fonticola]NBJ33761.1 methyltransferase [Serratia fonticola]